MFLIELSKTHFIAFVKNDQYLKFNNWNLSLAVGFIVAIDHLSYYINIIMIIFKKLTFLKQKCRFNSINYSLCQLKKASTISFFCLQPV